MKNAGLFLAFALMGFLWQLVAAACAILCVLHWPDGTNALRAALAILASVLSCEIADRYARRSQAENPRRNSGGHGGR